MSGIILKDFYEGFKIKKNILNWAFNILVFGTLAFTSRSQFSLILLATICIPLSGSSLLQMNVEQDEICDFNKIQLTLPITKKEIILSKYLSGLFILSLFLLWAFVITLLHIYVYKTTEFTLAMHLFGFGVAIGLFNLAISYFGFILLGNKRGLILYVFGGVFSILLFLAGYLPINFLSWDITIVLVVALIFSIISLIISYYSAIKVYTKKHS